MHIRERSLTNVCVCVCGGGGGGVDGVGIIFKTRAQKF